MKPKPYPKPYPKFSENISTFFVPQLVTEISKFENRTSDGEIFCRFGEKTLQYISYSTVWHTKAMVQSVWGYSLDWIGLDWCIEICVSMISRQQEWGCFPHA